jgi:hypothetical protein
VDRLQRDAGRPGGHRGQRHPDRLRHPRGGLRHPRRDRLRHLAAARPGAAPCRSADERGPRWLMSRSRSSSPG